MGEIQGEVQLRQAAKLQPLDDFAADVASGVFQRLDRVGLLFVRSPSVNEHARMLHIRLDAHFADHHHAFQSWIFELAREHGVDFVRDLFAHAFVTMIGRTHLHPLKRNYNAQLAGLHDLEFLPDQERAENAIGFVQHLLQ